MLSVREIPTTLSVMEIRDTHLEIDDVRTFLAYVHFDDVHLPVMYVFSATYAFPRVRLLALYETRRRTYFPDVRLYFPMAYAI